MIIYLGLLNDPSLYAMSQIANTSDIVDFVARKEKKNLVQVATPEEESDTKIRMEILNISLTAK